MNPMNTLVTGAAGFIGSHLCEALTAAGHQVVGLDAFTPYYDIDLKEQNARDIRAAGVELHRLDLATDDLAEPVRDADIVYHLAAQPGISATTPFDDYLKYNIVATHRLLEACREAPKLRLLVYVSTSSVYGADATVPETAEPKPTSSYGVTKLAAEQEVLSFHREGLLPACSLRLFSVYGPRERPEKLFTKLITAMLQDQPFTLCEGSEAHERSYTYISDIIDGLVGLLDHAEECAGEIINLGNDGSITTGRGIEIVEGILGRPAARTMVPPRPGDQARTRAVIDKARALLGYDPQISPEEGLRLQVEWARSRLLR